MPINGAYQHIEWPIIVLLGPMIPLGVALEIASQLNLNHDPFLMAVAIATSCAFLAPIGHKNNTLIMDPGGYKFSDY